MTGRRHGGEFIVRLHALFMLCGTSLALAGAAAAEPAGPPPNIAAGLPPGQIMAIVRAIGFDPIGRPVRNGNVYALQALDAYDVEYRIVVDARTGRTVSLREIARPGPYEAAPRFGGVIGGPPEGPALRPPHDVPHGTPAAPRVAPPPSQRSAATTAPLPPQKPEQAALPLPRPRPYVMDATSSTPVDPPAASARAAEAQPAPAANTAATETAPEPQPAADPPTGSVAK
jgi:hypothetical protein